MKKIFSEMHPSKYSFYLILVFSRLSDGDDAQDYCQPCSNGEAATGEGECPDLTKKVRALLAGTTQCAESQLELYQSECCSEPPRDRCTLCPDGSQFSGSTVVPNFEPQDGDMSCVDLNNDVYFLDYIFEAGKCDDTLLRRSAAWCGCPGVKRRCSLCPNGERPPNPGLVDPVYYGWDCDTFDFVSSYFSADECGGLVDSVFEFDAPSFCGCSGLPIPGVCDLCPFGHLLVNPDLRLGHNEKFTCRELALSTRYIPGNEPCTRVLSTHQDNGYVESCCAPIGTVPKRFGGTASGVQRPNVTALMALPTISILVSLLLLLRQ